MKMKAAGWGARFLVAIVVALWPAASTNGQKPLAPNDDGVLESVENKTDLYPADADAKQEIAEALKKATAEKKRVLLVFGADWCYDCHVLDRALHEGVAGQVMSERFLLVHVDIGEGA